MGDGSGGLPTAATFANLYQVGQKVDKSGIMHMLKEGTEGTLALVGTWMVINVKHFIGVYVLWHIL